MPAMEPRTSWPVPRHNDLSAVHNAQDEWCVCAGCSEKRGAAIRATAERLLLELMGVPSNDVEPEPFEWDEPMPLGETELSGREPGMHENAGARTVPRRSLRR
jgi:hypothetical protein